jgi:hypothetical protein
MGVAGINVVQTGYKMTNEVIIFKSKFAFVANRCCILDAGRELRVHPFLRELPFGPPYRPNSWIKPW